MPTVIRDTFSLTDAPTRAAVDYAALPVVLLLELAIVGDSDALAYLSTLRPSSSLTAAAGDFDESKHPRDEKGRFGEKVDGDAPRETRQLGWHLTDDPNFKPDPNRPGRINSPFGDLIPDEKLPRGVFVGDPEYWMHAHGYERPYVAEVSGTPNPDHAYYDNPQREQFLQGDLKTERVLTADEYARETYHDSGWVEEYFRPEGEKAPKIPNDYVGRPVSEMSHDEIVKWEQQFTEYANRPDGPRAAQRRADEEAMTAAAMIPSSVFTAALTTIPSAQLAVPFTVISFADWNEDLHPRDAHGRFGDKGDAPLLPAIVPPPPSSPWMNEPGYTQAGRDLLMHRADGTTVPYDDRHTDQERADAKAALVSDIASRMTSDPLDLVRATMPDGTNAWMLQGAAADEARAALIAERATPAEIERWGLLAGDPPVTTAEVLERLRSDPNMLADVRTMSDGTRAIHWMDVTTIGDTAEQQANVRADLLRAGSVPGDDPTIDTAIRYGTVNQMVGEWSGTSNDSSRWSLSLQDTAASMFGLKDTTTWDTSLMMPTPAGYKDAVAPVQRDFLKAMYDNTQAYLERNNIDSLVLRRGMQWDSEEYAPGWAKQTGDQPVQTRPISAWTGDPDEATNFAGGDSGNRVGAIVSTVVPAERILSTARTGLGCLAEDEFTVLGGTDTMTVVEAIVPGEVDPYNDTMVAAGSRPYDDVTRNEDWLRTMVWDLPTDPARFGPGELERLAALPAGEAMPASLRAHIGTLTAAGDWDEAKHPRDAHGRFGDKGASDDGGVLAIGELAPQPNPSPPWIRTDPDSDVMEPSPTLEQAAVNWQYYSSCSNARYAAETMLGQDHPTVPDFSSLAETTGDYSVLKSIEAARFLGDQNQETQTAVNNAHDLLAGVRDAPWSDLPLFRGMPLEPNQPGTAALQALKPGDMFDLSLVSFSNERNTAESFAMGRIGEPKMMFTLADGGKGVASDTTEIEVHVGGRVVDSGSNIGNYEGGSWERGHQDVVVGGRLEVVAVRPYVPEVVNPEPSKTTVEVVVRQVGVFDPDHRGELIPIKQHALAAAGGRARDYQRAPFWQQFGPGVDAKHGSAPMTAAGDFDESKHPRDSHGRFGTGDGTPREVEVHGTFFHGTDADFTEFDPKKGRSWFTSDPKYAQVYGKVREVRVEAPRVYVYPHTDAGMSEWAKPNVTDRDLERRGYDAVVFIGSDGKVDTGYALKPGAIRLKGDAALAGDWDESLHPRDNHGRFGTKDEPTEPKGGTTYVTRFGPDTPAAGDPNLIESTVARARSFVAFDNGQAIRDADPYPHADDFEGYADVPRDDNGEPLDPPDQWAPGSVYALSESATYWQESFENSRGVQAAADQLLGYQQSEARTAYEGEPPAAEVAVARELLNAMAGNGPEGAASAFSLSPEFDSPPTIGTAQFGPTELARGVDDKTGTMQEVFQHALDTNTTVAWSIASFVQGGDAGQVRMDQLAADNGADFEMYDPDTGDYVTQPPDDNAAMTALQYTSGMGVSGTDSPPVAPMLIRTSGTALNLDGGWEAVAGGKFAVDEVRPATLEEITKWNAGGFDTPITVVQLHQVENVQLPEKVKIT